MQTAIDATVRMLAWRGHSWTAVDPDETPCVRSLVPQWVDGCVVALEGSGTVVVVTDAPRIGLPLLKLALEALGGRALLVVSRTGVATQNQNLATFGARLTVVPWSLVLMYPLDHQLVPRHRKATPEDLQLLPRGTLRRRACLPAIRADDAIVQYLGLQVGDIVRIDRADDTIYFRVVIATR